jgi:hypothetical protein
MQDKLSEAQLARVLSTPFPCASSTESYAEYVERSQGMMALWVAARFVMLHAFDKHEHRRPFYLERTDGQIAVVCNDYGAYSIGRELDVKESALLAQCVRECYTLIRQVAEELDAEKAQRQLAETQTALHRPGRMFS